MANRSRTLRVRARPPSVYADPYDGTLLQDFLAVLPSDGPSYAMEFRHDSWAAARDRLIAHSRAHSMQTVQFSSSNAMTPRLRGGSSGRWCGYSCVTDGRVIERNVTARPLASPLPGTLMLLPLVRRR